MSGTRRQTSSTKPNLTTQKVLTLLLAFSTIVPFMSCMCNERHKEQDEAEQTAPESLKRICSENGTEIFRVRLHEPIDTTGNEELARATGQWKAAVGLRSQELASAAHDLLVEWPNREYARGRAQLQLELGTRSTLPSWHVDHPIMPWKTSCDESPHPKVDMVSEDDEDQEVIDLEVRVENEGENIRVTVGQYGDAGISLCTKSMSVPEFMGRRDDDDDDDDDPVSADRKQGTKDTGSQGRGAVDFVAGCAVVNYVRRGTHGAFRRWLLIGDKNEEVIDLLYGLEYYGRFVESPSRSRESEGESRGPTAWLNRAVDHFYKASSSAGTSNAFVEYMFLHAMVTSNGYYERGNSEEDYPKARAVAEHVFRVGPFDKESVRWTHALVYETLEDVEKAEKEWGNIVDTLGSPEGDQSLYPMVRNARFKARNVLANRSRQEGEIGEAYEVHRALLLKALQVESSRGGGRDGNLSMIAGLHLEAAIDLQNLGERISAQREEFALGRSIVESVVSERFRGLVKSYRMVREVDAVYGPRLRKIRRVSETAKIQDPSAVRESVFDGPSSVTRVARECSDGNPMGCKQLRNTVRRDVDLAVGSGADLILSAGADRMDRGLM